MVSKIDLLSLEDYEIKDLLKKGYIVVTVFGLGHVGLPLACAWLRAGAKVIGVAKTEKTVKTINRGENPVKDELTLTPIVKKYVSEGKFYATNNGIDAVRKANVVIIAVPTGVKWRETGKPIDLSILINVLETVGKGLDKGKLVIIEPTVPPGTTVNIAKPLLEKVSGLKVEKDFGLAYSPERTMAGHALQDIEENYPKIVSGIGPRSLRAVKALYEVVCKKGVIALSTPTAAEFEKIAEGVYRDVNIALANELAKFAYLLNIDFEEIRRAANSQPYCHLHKPGVGVGGYCIPIYPYFILHAAYKHGLELQLVRLARIINESMPEYVANLALKALEKINVKPEEAKVAILGLAFRGNIGDTRLTPVVDLVNYLESYGIRNIVIHDPYVHDNPTRYPLMKEIEKAIEGKDLVIVATDHDLYTKILPDIILKHCKKEVAIVDGRNIIPKEEIDKNKITYISVGGLRILKNDR